MTKSAHWWSWWCDLHGCMGGQCWVKIKLPRLSYYMDFLGYKFYYGNSHTKHCLTFMPVYVDYGFNFLQCDWLTSSKNNSTTHWAKFIVKPALAQGAKENQTSPWLVIAGDPGCHGIAHHFLAGAEQSSGPFAPWLMFFFSVPSHLNGTSLVSPDWKTIKLAHMLNYTVSRSPYKCI